MKLQEDFCSYEICELLSQKGFDEVCDHYIDYDWEKDGVLLHTPIKSSDLMFGYACPTHQMAMKWLRSKGIVIVIRYAPITIDEEIDGIDTHYVADIANNNNLAWVDNDIIASSYEEAVEAALKYSLENLI